MAELEPEKEPGGAAALLERRWAPAATCSGRCWPALPGAAQSLRLPRALSPSQWLRKEEERMFALSPPGACGRRRLDFRMRRPRSSRRTRRSPGAGEAAACESQLSPCPADTGACERELSWERGEEEAQGPEEEHDPLVGTGKRAGGTSLGTSTKPRGTSCHQPAEEEEEEGAASRSRRPAAGPGPLPHRAGTRRALQFSGSCGRPGRGGLRGYLMPTAAAEQRQEGAGRGLSPKGPGEGTANGANAGKTRWASRPGPSPAPAPSWVLLAEVEAAPPPALLRFFGGLV